METTFPVELPLYCAVLPALPGLHTLAYIDCACFKIKSNGFASSPLSQIT